jgi:hypothetical protein
MPTTNGKKCEIKIFADREICRTTQERKAHRHWETTTISIHAYLHACSNTISPRRRYSKEHNGKPQPENAEAEGNRDETKHDLLRLLLNLTWYFLKYALFLTTLTNGYNEET